MLDGLDIERVWSDLTVEAASPATFVLRLRMRAAREGSAVDLRETEARIKQSAEALFLSLRTDAGGDVFGFRDRLTDIPAEWSEADYALCFADAILRVDCIIEVRGGEA